MGGDVRLDSSGTGRRPGGRSAGFFLSATRWNSRDASPLPSTSARTVSPWLAWATFPRRTAEAASSDGVASVSSETNRWANVAGRAVRRLDSTVGSDDPSDGLSAGVRQDHRPADVDPPGWMTAPAVNAPGLDVPADLDPVSAASWSGAPGR